MFQRKKSLFEEVFVSKRGGAAVDRRQNIMAAIVPSAAKAVAGLDSESVAPAANAAVLNEGAKNAKYSVKGRLANQILTIKNKIGDEEFRRRVESLSEQQLASIIRMNECLDSGKDK